MIILDRRGTIEPLWRKEAEFDVLCASGVSEATLILGECGYKVGNLLGISFSDGDISFPEKRSEWIAIDVRSISGDYFEIDRGGIKEHVPCGRFGFEEPDGSVGRIGFNSIPGLDNRLDRICHAIKRSYGEKAVAIDLRDPLYSIGKDGDVKYLGDPDEDAIESANECLLGFVDRLGCFCVRTPTNILGSDSGRYAPEFLGYAESCLDAMVAGGEDARRRMIELGISIGIRMDCMRGESYAFDQDAIRRLDRQWNASNKKDGVDGLMSSAMARYRNARSAEGRGELERRIGSIWKDRKDGKADISKAAEWMRKSAGSGIQSAESDLLDILWREGSDDSLLEMVALARRMTERGNAKAMLILGRAYRDGKGLPQSKSNAIRWLSKASEKIKQAEIELKELEGKAGGRYRGRGLRILRREIPGQKENGLVRHTGRVRFPRHFRPGQRQRV